MIKYILYIQVLLLGFFACKTPYEPEIKNKDVKYLVVEGFIVNNGYPTVIKLSRTTGLKEVALAPETGANLSIEVENGNVYNLYDLGDGSYSTSNSLNVNNQKVRLKIVTSNNTVYLSDYVESKATPVIDSISWRRVSGGVNVNMNTHDDTGNSKYYFWNYDETWQFTSKYRSNYEYKEGEIFTRMVDIYTCWKTQYSSQILLGSSVKNTHDVISENKLILIPNGSEKLGIKYSINVRQYVLTREAYEYWENIKKNNEDIGGIFDSQPSYIQGNIYNVTDKDEPVIGFVSVAGLQEKRIFIEGDKVGSWRMFEPAYAACVLDTTKLLNIHIKFAQYMNLPTDPVIGEDGEIMSYLGTSRNCADCTIRGTNIRPSFWQ